MIEMMLTLMIVSIILLVSIIHIPEHDTAETGYEVKNIAYVFQATQTRALQTESPHLVEMDYINQQILIKDSKGDRVNHYELKSCKLIRGGLTRFIYRSTGDTSAFGTLRFSCYGKPVSFIFQIQKGRFRIEQ